MGISSWHVNDTACCSTEQNNLFAASDCCLKVMIRNRYNYLTTSVQDTKGKEGRTYSNATTIKTLQTDSKKEGFFPKKWPKGYLKTKQNKKITRIYMQMHTIVTGEKILLLDSKSYTLPRRYKSWFIPQGSTSVSYTYHCYTMTETVNHSRITALERSVKTLLGAGWGLGRGRLSSAVEYTCSIRMKSV